MAVSEGRVKELMQGTNRPRRAGASRAKSRGARPRAPRLLPVEVHSRPALIGRDAQLRSAEELLARAEVAGASLAIRGGPGVGKSALLLEVAARASERGTRVLRATGTSAEQALAFAGLHQLLRPVLGEAERLPRKQRQALLGAFGMADADSCDVFLVGLATLALLSDSAAQRPLLLIVDDAHWLDRRSREVVTFVGRRLQSDAIALLMATREACEDAVEDPGLGELALGPLDDDASEALLDASAPGLAPAVRERLLSEAAGNPLALVELPISARRLPECTLLPAQLPLTARLQQAFAASALTLPADTRGLLLVAALNDVDSVRETLDAGSILAGAQLALEALTPAAGAGLIELDDWQIRFRHPLMRPAIVQSATLGERRAAHAALAQALVASPDRRVWHRAASIAGTDEDVAAELELAAPHAHTRAGIGAGIAALERAAQLSADPARRGARLLCAAELALETGREDLVRRLLDAVESLCLEPVERARSRWLGELLRHTESPSAVKLDRLLEIVEELRVAGASELAMNRLLSVATLGWWTDRDPLASDALAKSVAGLNAAADDPRRLAVEAFAAPLRQPADVLERLSRVEPETVREPTAALRVAVAAQLLGGVHESAGSVDASVANLRREGRLAGLAEALEAQAWNGIWLGAWDEAAAAAGEAARLAHETRNHPIAAAAQNVRAWLAALKGDGEAVQALTDASERSYLPAGRTTLLAVAHVARGVAALGEGSHAVAYDELRRIFDPADVAHDLCVGQWVIGDLVEAAVHCERGPQVAAIVAELELVAARTGSPLLLAGLSYARPLLADDDERAQALFEAALGGLALWPFLRARVLLAQGIWLRRRRRVSESRAPLRGARDAFDALGAAPWGERARQELRASGETSRSRSADTRDQLSPQELQIALMAAEGLSNREIGQRLFLSHRTVGSHLYRVFPKLGITTRAELSRALGDTLAAAA
jgi:DNA-binding CsgD family transcriptional regulator